MNKCIFCKLVDRPFKTKEHILPESLGGGDWAILAEGLCCDVCQNRFGSEIEQQALGDYPFSFLRTFIGIPTKKGRKPWFKSWEGTIRASLFPGKFEYDPALPFHEAYFNGTKSQIRLLAHPLRPHMICRFLIKMGIEIVAMDNSTDVFDSKFDDARQFSLNGNKKIKWWYLQQEDIEKASKYFTQGITLKDWNENLKLEVIKLDKGQEIFHLNLLYLNMFIPLTTLIQPEFSEFKEPEFRLFRVD